MRCFRRARSADGRRRSTAAAGSRGAAGEGNAGLVELMGVDVDEDGASAGAAQRVVRGPGRAGGEDPGLTEALGGGNGPGPEQAVAAGGQVGGDGVPAAGAA